MVVRFGMDPKLGQVAYEPERRSMLQTGRPDYQPRTYSEETAAGIDDAVRALVDGAYHLSQRILATNEQLLRKIRGRAAGTRDADRRAAGCDQHRRQPQRPRARAATRAQSGRVSHRRCRGSAWSRSASPSRLNPSTATRIASPGNVAIHQADRK